MFPVPAHTGGLPRKPEPRNDPSSLSKRTAMKEHEELTPGKIYLFLPEDSPGGDGERLYGLFEGRKNGWPHMKAIMFDRCRFLHDLPLPSGYRCVREADYEEVCDFCFRHGFAFHRQLCLSGGGNPCTPYGHWTSGE